MDASSNIESDFSSEDARDVLESMTSQEKAALDFESDYSEGDRTHK